MRQNRTTVHLVGGLGNQLFIYAFGRYYELQSGRNVTFDKSAIPHGFTKRSSDIDQLALPGTFVTKRAFLLRQWLNGAKRRLTKGLGLETPFSWQSTEVGYEDNFDLATPWRHVRGYFQCSTYLEQLQSTGRWPDVSLRTPTAWFTKMLPELINPNVIAVHCRFGDFLSLSESFGVLGPEYYFEALQAAFEGHDPSVYKVFVFSDEPARARELFADISLASTLVFVEPPKTSSSAESLVLMSEARKIIIANSTFSWWAASLNAQNTKLVIAPRKWFRGLEDPARLYPSHWVTVDSQWA